MAYIDAKSTGYRPNGSHCPISQLWANSTDYVVAVIDKEVQEKIFTFSKKKDDSINELLRAILGLNLEEKGEQIRNIMLE